MIRAGIVGAAGYTGGELIGILLDHPEVEITFCQSQSQSGKKIDDVHTSLYSFNQKFSAEIEDADVLFFCMGHGRSKKLMLEEDFHPTVKIIDLSHDFRLKNGHDFIYGLPELHREKIKNAKFVANPGCFATAIELALLPLAARQLIHKPVHVHGITGSTGAGQSLSETSHFSWRNNNVSIYKPFAHQHLAEIRQSITELDPKFNVPIYFVPARGNFTRGILASIYLECDIDHKAANDLFRDYYIDHPFVQVTDRNPDIKMVVNTNMCLLNIQVYDGIIHVISVIDNLVKGASGQAVQNMNLIFGFPERTGLNLKSSVF